MESTCVGSCSVAYVCWRCCHCSLPLCRPDSAGRALTVGEEFVNPLGFHSATPVFSWKLADGVVRQTAYRLEVRTNGTPWDSGWVQSDQSVFVPYQGPPLHARDSVSWRVNVRRPDFPPTLRSSDNTCTTINFLFLGQRILFFNRELL